MNRIVAGLALLLGAASARAGDPTVGEWVTLKGEVKVLLFMYPDQTYMRFEFVPGPNHMRVKEFGIVRKSGAGYVMRARRMVLEWPATFDPDPKHAKSLHPANSGPYPLRAAPLTARYDSSTQHLLFGGRTYARIGNPVAPPAPRRATGVGGD
jgi:hypothetical protein